MEQVDQIREDYKIKTEGIIQNMQQAIDESFNRIDAQLDQIFNDKFSFIQRSPSQLQSDLPKINTLFQFQNYDYQKQINQEVTSLIKTNIQKVFQKKDQYYQNQQKENQIKWENKIQEKDYQIQQFINKQTIQQSSISTQFNLKPFTYQLIQQNSIKQNELCFVIAINQDCSILVAGCDSQIKVFEFQQEIMKQVQLQSEHGGCVTTLNFMKRSDQFISGSNDKQIIIWKRNQSNSWISQQKLNGHTNLIVSGSCDNQIKFWLKQNEWICSQIITDHNVGVYGLSLNEQQNRVISCGDGKFIIVIEEQNKQWIVIQKITVEINGYRLCFIDDNTFTFQPYAKEYMHVFEMNSTNKYTKTKDIPVKGGSDSCSFPQQYIKSKCILVNKNASNVNLIRKKQNGEFIIEQSIYFGTGSNYGYMTDDGQYLITWDYQTKEYQIGNIKNYELLNTINIIDQLISNQVIAQAH
ncbi:unnamed protein product [Paramecium primaurelia]|uniref:WD40-repeat-containing domain n=1 Tax=Paramecium primaurelia TaxID=5886 RepID=A0A8S1KYW4_PARPR|nr:unnamed protein product [Paramecium primaurelia]